MTDRDEERAEELGLVGGPYDWGHVFHYANGGEDGPFWILPEQAKDDQDTGLLKKAKGFDLADVKRVEASIDGENDGAHWAAFGVLSDGRWFSVEAWCDYTGWGCQEGGTSRVASNREDIIKWGLAANERIRLGVPLAGDTPE